MDERLLFIKESLKKKEYYENAALSISFDQATVSPEKAMDEKNGIIAFLEQQAFDVMQDEKIAEYITGLYRDIADFDEWDATLIRQLYRQYLIEKNLTSDEAYDIALSEKQAFTDWSVAKEKSDYELFRPSLSKVIAGCRKKADVRELMPEEEGSIASTYDRLIDLYERGMTTEKIDPVFEEVKERLLKLIRRIENSKKVIRTNFLSREVSIEEQRRVTEYLMKLMGFDFTRGMFATSEHAYTERLSANDIRITTHFYTDNFISNIYTVLHENGHALFDQRQPEENNEYFIYGGKTLGMHESVSRFYENIIGRSRDFIELIYPALKELMPKALYDVSADELYEAVNLVKPSLIRTEADEVTYGLHVIIRYELERMIFEGELDTEDIPSAWNKKYLEYLGIEPKCDREGVLQDVHWASDFGYFPTYLLGNLYNAMYYNRMCKELDIPAIIRAGEMEKINGWMTENVFRKADRLSPAEWIYDITGRQLCADDFLSYLEAKYEKLYEL